MSNSSHDRCNTCAHRDDRAQKAANAAEGRPLGTTLPANIAKEAPRQVSGQHRIQAGFIQLGIPIETYNEVEKRYLLPYLNLIRAAPEEQQTVTLSLIRREGSAFGLIERDGHLRNADGSRAFPNRDETMDSLDMRTKRKTLKRKTPTIMDKTAEAVSIVHCDFLSGRHPTSANLSKDPPPSNPKPRGKP